MLGVLALSASAPAAPPCPGGVRCGSVTVPLDRQNPSAGRVEIHYVLVPHADKTRPASGTIVPNPGGPGQSTIASAGIYLQAPAPLLRDRDLLVIDPPRRRHPVRFTAHSPLGPVRLTLGERELANVTVGGDPRDYGLLPAAVDTALNGDLALLKRLVTVSRVDEVRGYVFDPTMFSVVAGE